VSATATICVVAAPIAALTIWMLLRSPLAARFVAAPSGDRWHATATPTLGGVGIFAGFAAAVLLALAVRAVGGSSELLGILGGAAIVFAFGLLDDLRSQRALVKLAAQIGAAAVTLACGLRVDLVSNGVLAALLGGLWLVGMTNAFNLLDNMDGLAGSLAVVAATFFAIDAVYLHKENLLLVVSLSIGCAALGFLPFNFRPHRPAAVFMGDSGSQVLGFVLAALGLATSWKVAESTVATLLLPLLVLAVPILDTALVTASRAFEGRPITQGGRDHTSHRLVRGGLGEKSTVVLLTAVAAGLGVSSLAYSVIGNPRITLVGVLVTFVILVQFAGFVTDLDRGRTDTSGGPVLLRRVLLAPRRLVEVLADFVLISVAFGVAYLLFTTGDGTTNQKHIFLVSLPVIVGARYVAFLVFGLYNGVWRFAGAREAAAIAAAVILSEPVAVGIIWFSFGPFGDFPASIYLVDALVCIALIGASRFGERALFHALGSLRSREAVRTRTLIVGAGRSGRSLLRELRETPGEQVVGFVDDDPRLRGRRMQGVPVLGRIDEIDRVLGLARPDVVLVTIPNGPRERLDAIVAGCERADVSCRFVRRELDLDPLVVMGAGVE
jgi:UDP-GlcNAc:undecaprenyl-phosphate/decaprenyl-phosphate GlcNAc-1-phosphate transferase